jgi:nitrate/nitrite transporter NarK
MDQFFGSKMSLLQTQGNIDNSKPWYLALALLVGFSLFVQMAEGTSYGMVPFMNREQLAVVSALVGAGGNVGAMIAGYFFYDLIEDELLPFSVHAGYVLFWALLSPCYYWPDKGGMFRGPVEQSPQKSPESAESVASSATE